MIEAELLQQMTEAIVVGVEDTSLALAKEGLARGIHPLDIVHKGFMPGLDVISHEYETGTCFVPELVVAGTIMEGVLNLVRLELRRSTQSMPMIGRIVIGTVAGDVHNIGKNLVSTILSISGFEVLDVGTNVPPEVLVGKARTVKAHILGLSALTTPTLPVQRDVIELLEEMGMRDDLKVIVGGGAASAEWANLIGADGYAENAMQAVTLCRDLINNTYH
ncbi:MAG: B12-binding domain-containing protein [Anaerolineae bacterium]